MKVIAIFAQSNETEFTDLWAIFYDKCECNEFEKAFDNWTNPEYLLNFFKKNREDLINGFYGIESIEDAIDKTIDQAYEFEELLLKFSYHNNGANFDLNKLFKPLNNNDYRFESDLQKTKARKNWLRLYSIKLHPSSFVVSGSAIKLCFDMDRPHLKEQLKNLDVTKSFLSEKGYLNSDDLK